MPNVALATLILLATAAAANAQQDVQIGASGTTMGALASQGYEIKAAAPNGSRYVVFMQKDTSAYACEFVNTTQTQCRQIN
ncbi:hypothetical protein KYK30_13895 [Shinella yambaruensis]|uniref:Uncharacterized protein n=1 Tax=Shinella yambaruensis TaxID=415996 RepID=A0ABQ5ZA26_9HYPH|nr:MULTISPECIES: hypothetical protein [Shinella]CAI0337150.1 conserved exported hypothetical protein [Rhizobiaceae bacterium]CAK7255662.1 Signal peptide protein [Shinella sp. WSC3-e]MCJ8024350.1 hypothetical protein [Shinella yambaruensis]MCO5135913.1 hypothetical protein [Shinella sp.]MCU7980792.1 hypothetical protein [Shinella yambaruensis]